MKIKSMTATFGRLDRARLEPGEGLTLIHAPNEGGKSTWCAFWKTMLFGLDTRDRDKKGYLADKNHYQPWSGTPMEGELRLEWQGRDITLRRGPRGSVPMGAFSAVYTGTREPVPQLTAPCCGETLIGAGRGVFERSAFVGAGGELAVTAAPELEKRIAALVSSGEEDVSFSQAQSRLKEWLNRRRVNKSVGLIPRLEEELARTEESLAALRELSARLARLEEERRDLEGELAGLQQEESIHRRLAQRELDRRFAQAGQELRQAQGQLAALEEELAKYGPLPPREELRRAQGELQYLKVLEEEIRQGEGALKEAEEAYVQAQIAAQDERFHGLSADEAAQRGERDAAACRAAMEKETKGRRRSLLLFGAGLVALPLLVLFAPWPWLGPALFVLCDILSFLCRAGGKQAAGEGAQLLSRYGVERPEEIPEVVRSYRERLAAADQAALQARTLRGTLSDRRARRDNSQTDLLQFVHTFAPQASGLFGCSAALSRALALDHELALARERLEERRRRREDLAAQGGRDVDTLEELVPPSRSPQQTRQALEEVSGRLNQTKSQLNQLLGRQKGVGDPAALEARREELSLQLERRTLEYQAISAALEALDRANAQLQQRLSPALNRLAGEYLARLTGGRYSALPLNRELEGAVAREEDVTPRSALYLSRGTADQLYLAVRLAVSRLCLPQLPPLVLDDALAAFDDERMELALGLLKELAREQQVLVFTCRRRELEALEGDPTVTCLTL